MLLVSAKVGPFKSINEPQTVPIDTEVTVLVGMNEAGKTVFLQALQKATDALGEAEYDPINDYPRKELSTYLDQHEENPSIVAELTYRLDDKEIAELNSVVHTHLKPGFEFTINHKYDNHLMIVLTVDESPVLASLVATEGLSSDSRAAIKNARSVRSIPEILKEVSLTEEDTAFRDGIEKRVAATQWTSIVQWEVWQWLKPRIPQFLYFSEYELLPSKINLPDLASRIKNNQNLEPKHRAILALLRMARISVDEFTDPEGYEKLKARIEAVSIKLTDQIMKFWKQNEDLDVEVDIKQDPTDSPPYNNGSNLYLRIKNRRHRVSTPFEQRSRGFIWFFSFLVWFDSVQQQIDAAGQGQLILLLDEPGLSLHALAQNDLLRYIDELSAKHQVLYTTHSPFMVHSDRLRQVRMVEDQPNVGTVVSNSVSGSDPRTLFPLQAALGWTIAQNLFISKHNLLVEGPSDLIYLQALSAILEDQNRTRLRGDIVIVPVGGLDKVVTFIALLGANGLKLAVLHDYRGASEQKLMDLVKEKIIPAKMLLNISLFRDRKASRADGVPSDMEDLFKPEFYLERFNKTFGTSVSETDLPPGDRIVDRLNRYIDKTGIKIRPSGGFNHYLVASNFAANPPKELDKDTLKRFETLFAAINKLL
ncbi:MAG TPA: AAA family ATPase [Syntrophorhabdaceae bacterium]|nr:AAA family ATPase [Syntrophorhabdaceae bacterium]